MSNRILTKSEIREQILKKCPVISSVLNECSEEEKVNMIGKVQYSVEIDSNKNSERDALLNLANNLLDLGMIRKTKADDLVKAEGEIISSFFDPACSVVRYDILVTKLEPIPGMKD